MSNSCLPYQAPILIATAFQASGIIATCFKSHQKVSSLAFTGVIEISKSLSGPTRCKFCNGLTWSFKSYSTVFSKVQIWNKIYFKKNKIILFVKIRGSYILVAQFLELAANMPLSHVLYTMLTRCKNVGFVRLVLVSGIYLMPPMFCKFHTLGYLNSHLCQIHVYHIRRQT